MKKGFLLVAVVFLFLQGCNGKNKKVDSITGATPKVPESADVSFWPQTDPEEDVSTWHGETPNEEGVKTVLAGSSVNGPYIEAYTDKKSYLPGEIIHFHVSTTAAKYSMWIAKEISGQGSPLTDILTCPASIIQCHQ